MKIFKKNLYLFFSMLFISLLCIPFFSNSQIPQSSLKMMSVSGSEYSVNDLTKENGVLIIFISNDCNLVIKNQQRAIAVSDYAKRKNVGVVFINSNEKNRNGSESLDAMKQYSKNQNFGWEYLLDKNGIFASAIGATKAPEVYLYNKNNQLVYSGAIDDNPADELRVTQQYLRDAIDQMAAGKEVGVKKSKVIGCTIKK